MLLLDKSIEKSETVTVWTILSKKDTSSIVSTAVVEVIDCFSASTSVPPSGFMIETPAMPSRADIVAVKRNTIMILIMIFPSLFIPFMLAIAEAILKKTRGTIITNIAFKNKSPNGFTTEASVPNTTPAIPPIVMPISNKLVNL